MSAHALCAGAEGDEGLPCAKRAEDDAFLFAMPEEGDFYAVFNLAT